MQKPEPLNDYFPDELPDFVAGQIVRHKRYGYRGVIVDFDMRCLADEQWYQRNETQPDRDQPWYHVLVDGSATVTYAAQESLIVDDDVEPITHPLLRLFFRGFKGGRYERGERLWPSLSAGN